jgi:hypothetical protein
VVVAAIHLNLDLVDHECIPMPLESPESASSSADGLGDETFAIGPLLLCHKFRRVSFTRAHAARAPRDTLDQSDQ